jgi:hypothetical protein
MVYIEIVETNERFDIEKFSVRNYNMSTSNAVNHDESYNNQNINYRVGLVLSKLRKGHSRPEAFRAINEANITDRKGNKIVPSVWYHSLCYVQKANSKTYMEENFPKFVPTESPYVRPKSEKKVEEKIQKNQFIPHVNDEMFSTIAQALNELREMVVSLESSNQELRASIESLKPTKKNSVSQPQNTETKTTEKPKDNSIHASIHKEDVKIDTQKVAA